ncbi:hypothetical protein WR25_04969 [Diploscapter pachys]|uniref:Uncharacterized protein n=1 Tax=Diploscapter pachys TaxID=2018661 RepID=A0A2A2M4F6_9BILA|nr:hypothetical protein WR25_04969 [Diploscapter pachys]
MESGIGTLSQDDLDQLTAGRQLGLDFGIDDDAFSIATLSSPKDYADELTLAAAKLAYPRWDAAPVARAKSSALTAIPGYDSSADGVLSRDLEGLLHDGDQRWLTPSAKTVSSLTPEQFKAFWAPLLASGPIEVDVASARCRRGWTARPRRRRCASPRMSRAPCCAITTAPTIRRARSLPGRRVRA